MKNKQIAGLVLIAVGVGLLYFGYQEYDSVGSKFTKAFSGNPTDRAMWMLIGGGASALLGAFLGFFSK